MKRKKKSEGEKLVADLHGEARCQRYRCNYVGTVRDFLNFLETADMDALLGGIFEPLDHCSGLVLLWADGRMVPAPRTWDNWGLVAQALHNDDRSNPVVAQPLTAVYSAANLALSMDSIRCNACGHYEANHDGILLRCRYCGWKREGVT